MRNRDSKRSRVSLAQSYLRRKKKENKNYANRERITYGWNYERRGVSERMEADG